MVNFTLTPREMQVLVLITSCNLSNPEIAERLGIGQETVKTHVSNILTKLGVERREDLYVNVPTTMPPADVASRDCGARQPDPPAGVPTFRPWDE